MLPNEIGQMIGISSLVSILIFLIGKWITSRLESSIKYEYDTKLIIKLILKTGKRLS